MINILYIHQSAELYGSDKTLLYLVSDIRDKGFHPIVVLPSNGPLFQALQQAGIETIIAPVLKISRNMFRPGNLLSLPFQTFKAFGIIRKQLKGRTLGWVHSNTLAVLLGALYAKRYGVKHLWHVHEIIEHPRLISELYPKLVDFFSDKVVYNSKATMDFMVAQKPALAAKSTVVHNGIERTVPPASAEAIAHLRQTQFSAGPSDIVLGLVGRISRWKGQSLLLEAFAALAPQYPMARLVFVGSAPPNQEHFEQSLRSKIDALQLRDRVAIIPFTTDIWQIWDSLDIAVVPSTEPEPFGLVAVEAMLAAKPVVGAAHGGLTEIIIEGQTGLFFTPGDASALQRALGKLIADASLRNTLGQNGKARAESHFSQNRYVEDFSRLYQ